MKIGFGMILLLVGALCVTGLALLIAGLRGRPALSAPRCARCGYDVRAQAASPDGAQACPECGADLHAEGAVSFGAFHRNRRQILAGLALMVIPLLLSGLLLMGLRQPTRRFAGGPAGVATLNNTQLLAALPGAIDSPWEWQELQRRRTAGQLTGQETDQAVAALINGLKTRRAQGMRQTPLHWAGTFATDAIANQAIPAARVAELMQAFYGDEPSYVFRRKVREGEPLRVSMSVQSPWNLGNHRAVYSLASIRSREVDLPLQTAAGQTPHPDEYSGMNPFHPNLVVTQSLPTGIHILEFTWHMGVVTADAVLRGLDGKPGPPEKWPDPLARWQVTTRHEVEIVPRDTPVVDVVTDPALNPFEKGSLAVAQVAVRPASGGVELVLTCNLTGPISVPLAYRIWLHPPAEGPPIACGNYVIEGWTGGTHTTTRSVRLSGLDPAIRQADVVMVPDAALAEHYPQIDRIWGQETRINGVKLDRFDLAKPR